ncbi:cupin domain-containing protein [Verticiella sediminum]|uniref:cupin domain-containing protein n=1 Tax=Verticiella sediminum TaxID=1247510 RepID=UPI001FE6036E|nr:cupin domain-containing protein [Verticiella sediminum]
MTPVLPPRARALIDTLGLQPHPEGGYFREVHRADAQVQCADGQARAAMTTIFFLLPAGAVSRWHRVSSDEVWHYYEGAPLELAVLPAHASAVARMTLGLVATGTLPLRVVPAQAWQAARSLGEYTLVGCSVGPGFTFADFVLLDALPGAQWPAALAADRAGF